jgi:hypothetical protein
VRLAQVPGALVLSDFNGASDLNLSCQLPGVSFASDRLGQN